MTWMTTDVLQSYVPHANKALRSFNMYLNVRRPPLRSKFSFNPLSWFYSRPPATLKPDSTFPATPASSDRSTTIPISPIPPSSNPRGELIFSSRVDRSFRESYERYRGAFERKRQERERSAAMRTWLGWLTLHMPWNKQRTAVQPVAGATQDRAASASGRKTGHRVPTPSPAVQSGPSSSPLGSTTPSVRSPSHLTHKLMKVCIIVAASCLTTAHCIRPRLSL